MDVDAEVGGQKALLANEIGTEMVGKLKQIFGVQRSPNGVEMQICGMQKSRKLRSIDSVRLSE